MSQPDMFTTVRTGEAAEEREKYNQRYQNYYSKIKFISLSILLLGPHATTKTALSGKLLEIQSALESQGHNVIFRDDLSPYDADLSQRTQKLAQAIAAHLTIALDDSSDVVAEISDFCAHPNIIDKFFVMIPELQQDFSDLQFILGNLRGFGGVHWYHDEEIDNCNLLKEATKRANARRGIFAFKPVEEVL
jgi:hypothetical protein